MASSSMPNTRPPPPPPPHIAASNIHDDDAGRGNPRQLVSNFIASLPQPAPGTLPSANANPLRDFSGEARNTLLALYALFEKELLPALDLLDRGLVSRLRLPSSTPLSPLSSLSSSSSEANSPAARGLLLVRSAQQNNARNRATAYEHVNYYEVRLDAWSCSCPAFAFSAFPPLDSASESRRDDKPQRRGKYYFFGGLSLGECMPVCKHLLACVLLEHCEMLAHFADEREVSIEEMAGWAAGWGD